MYCAPRVPNFVHVTQMVFISENHLHNQGTKSPSLCPILTGMLAPGPHGLQSMRGHARVSPSVRRSRKREREEQSVPAPRVCHAVNVSTTLRDQSTSTVPPRTHVVLTDGVPETGCAWFEEVTQAPVRPGAQLGVWTPRPHPALALSLESSFSAFGELRSSSLLVFPLAGQRTRNGGAVASLALGNLTLLAKILWDLLPVLSPSAWILKTQTICEPSTISGVSESVLKW